MSSTITPAELAAVYEQVKTPVKHGLVLHPPEGTYYDCPSVFRFNDRWYMLYVSTANKVGYQTHLATSDDLFTWREVGTVLPFSDDPNAWDRWQADGGIALADPTWGGGCSIGSFEGKYWLSYLGGALQGYETDPLSIGLAWTSNPTDGKPWTRLANNPVLAPWNTDVRPFEKKTLYKSFILDEPTRSLGGRFVMYYNGKQEGPGIERIGMALSDDLLHWRRFGVGPVIDNGPKGISGDPQLVRIGDLWVMFYFGHVWKPKAFDTFACSRDLVNWTTWDGPHLIEPSEPYDDVFAHKPWVLKWQGVVYHFYCAVSKQGVRSVALATSGAIGLDQKPGGSRLGLPL